MAVLRSGLTMATGAAWLLTGVDPLGRRLIKTLSGGDEDQRTLAGMLLVKGGDRGRRLVTAALRGGAEAPELITVLQSLGGGEAEAVIAEVARDETRSISRWAKQALSEMRAMGRGDKAN